MKRSLLFLLTVPASLLGFVVLLVLKLLRQGRLTWVDGGLVLFGRPVSTGGFMTKHWRWSTTFGPHAIYFDCAAHGVFVAHELKHQDQAKGVSLAWFLTSCIATAVSGGDLHVIVLLLLLWPLCWPLAYAGASIAAWYKGEDAYYGNEFEKQAYALQLRAADSDRSAALKELDGERKTS